MGHARISKLPFRYRDEGRPFAYGYEVVRGLRLIRKEEENLSTVLIRLRYKSVQVPKRKGGLTCAKDIPRVTCKGRTLGLKHLRRSPF